MSAVIWSGSYAGKTLPEVLFTDPDWFFDALENGKFQKFQEELVEEAGVLARKSRNIKVIKKNPDKWSVIYFFYPEGGFTRFDIVRADRNPHVGSRLTTYSKNIDMSIIRSVKEYDKRWYRRLLRQLKTHLFDNEDERMTKEKCQKFFANRKNFAL